MPVTPAVDLRDRGTARLIRHVAMLERLMRDPGRRFADPLEDQVGREMARLALAAAGARALPVPASSVV